MNDSIRNGCGRGALRSIAALLAAFSISGCATQEVRSPMLAAFQRLVTEVGEESSQLADYSSTVSINGLGRQDLVGGSIYFPGSQLSDHFAVTIAPGLSLLLDKRYALVSPDPKNFPEAGTKSTCFISVEKVGAESAVLAIRDMYICARAALVTTAAKQAAWAAAQLSAVVPSERKNTYLKSVLGVTEDDKIQEALKKAEVDAANAEKEANLAMADVKRGIRARNIVLAKWATRREASAGGGVGALFGASGRKVSALNGILILGDLRVTTLQPGTDFLLMLRNDEKGPLAQFYRELQMPMYSLQAKYQAYVQDLDIETAFEASLSISVAQLSQIAGGGIAEVLKSETVKLGARIAELASIGDAGYLSPTSASKRTFCFHKEAEFAKAMAGELSESAPYSNVYVVRGTPGKRFYDRHLAAIQNPSLVKYVSDSEPREGCKGDTVTNIWPASTKK
jgi:hypothetical protein